MTEKEKLEVIKHSYEVLQVLVKDLNERVKDAKDRYCHIGPKPDNGELVWIGLHRRAHKKCLRGNDLSTYQPRLNMPKTRRKSPNCGRYMVGYPAISRKDNKTEICSTCGLLEALDAYINRG